MDDKIILAELAALQGTLKRKVRDRDAIGIEIMQIEEKIRALYRTFFTDALAEKGRQLTAVGLTEAIRILLRKQGKPMSAAEVKMGLEILGFELRRFKNPASVIHNTLIRMAKAGELVYSAATNSYRFAGMDRALYGDVPNPFGKNLAEMLDPGRRK